MERDEPEVDPMVTTNPFIIRKPDLVAGVVKSQELVQENTQRVMDTIRRERGAEICPHCGLRI